MTNTLASELAQEIVDTCLRDKTWPARALERLIERAINEEEYGSAIAATRALFGIVIERLADLFEPDLCELYASLFSHIISRALPQFDPDQLVLRYRHIRHLRRFAGGEVQLVFVLSRITLGADIAVTSMVIEAMKRRFPDAPICFVGPKKNAELFSSDMRIVHVPFDYERLGSLRNRLSAALELRTLVDLPGAIVIDPDSRLTQLGLIQVCDDSRYYFFESRAFGGNSEATLSELTAEWLAESFNVRGVRPYLAPPPLDSKEDITVSLGVGENLEKRFEGDFEFRLLESLLEKSRTVMLDRGAGGEETERVNTLACRLGYPPTLTIHDGSYASFASHIVQSRLYVGYDSAGQHVAAAAGTPLVSIFKGHSSERMFFRWRPTGRTAQVIRVDNSDWPAILTRTLDAIAAAGKGPQVV